MVLLSLEFILIKSKQDKDREWNNRNKLQIISDLGCEDQVVDMVEVHYVAIISWKMTPSHRNAGKS
jgi:hypothetical protein